MSAEQHYHITDPVSEITYRTGQAAAVFPPEFVAESGCVIEAPADYLTHRPDAVKNAYVIVNKSKMPYSIRLKLNEGTTLPTGHVEGVIEYHPEYETWCINKDRGFDPAGLLKVVRPRRSHFANPSVYDAVVDRLAHFKAQLRTDIEQTRDGFKGVKADATRRQVVEVSGKDNPEQDPSFSFVLAMPILRGMKVCTFEVAALVEPRDATIALTLESIEARDLTESLANHAIDTQVTRLSKFNIPILFK